jgi:hypothetical protein
MNTRLALLFVLFIAIIAANAQTLDNNKAQVVGQSMMETSIGSFIITVEMAG